ncbi:tail fiber assembly protein [Vreelandella olivaria]|uniref:DUF4376 domain-containing protein n=1 Tax=Vreelandella olivaria TaxID=390919 RepID=UPI00201EFE27|nr:DUF4376 domain-containing protein [Halomonas olivaria]
MLYSATENGFYPEEFKTSYVTAGNWPNDLIEITPDEWETFQSLPPEGHELGSDPEGRPKWVPLPPENLRDLAERKRRELDAARDAAFAAGLEYDFNGEIDVVQTRPEDQINLLGLSAQAQRLIAAGQPDSTLTFRGLKNVNRELTATEIDSLTLAALGHIEDIYQHSWELKDMLQAALLDGDREKIEQLFW